MRGRSILAGMFCAALSHSVVFAGPNWTEPPGFDAGSDPVTAQSPTGPGPLKTIAGDLGSTVVASGPDNIDFEDVFLIRICDAGRFCARTETNFNAHVWLFDQDGRGILGNRIGPDGANAFIFPPATDDTRKTLPGPGLYFLAISMEGIEPLSNGEIPIFQFDTVNAGEISGPDGPGGQFPLTNWTRPPGSGVGGQYLLRLEGAEFAENQCQNWPYVTDPCSNIPTLSEWGVAVLFLVLMTCGTILVGRRYKSADGATGLHS